MTDKFRSSALNTSLIYWALSFSGIFAISFVVHSVVPGYHAVFILSFARAFVFASATGVLIYFLMARSSERFRRESDEQAAAEAALKTSELHLKSAQRLANIGSWEWDRTARKLTFSDEMFRIFQLEPEDFNGSPDAVTKRIHPDDLERFREVLSGSVVDGKPMPTPIEFRIVRPDGEVRTLLAITPPEQEEFTDTNHVMGIIQDVTEARHSQDAFRESEQRLKQAERFSHLGSGVWDLRNDTTTWSDEMYSIFGIDKYLPPPRFSERPAFYTADSWKRFGEVLKRAIEIGESYDEELVVVRPDGSVREVRARGRAERDDSGNIIRLLGTVQDITDWKRVEETLRLQASALQSAGDAIVITDNQGAITYSNPAFTKLTGYALEEVKGKTMEILNSGMQDALFYRNLWDTITSGIVWRGHLVNRRKDGTTYYEEQTITPIRAHGEQVRYFIAIKRDMTGQMRAEETLKSSMTQLRELSARLEKVREDERKSLSHEVHDELGQVLTAVKMRLLDLEKTDPGLSDQMVTKVRSTVLLVDEAMKTVRDIAGRLRPGVLDYLGLMAAVDWQIEQFEKNYGITCQLLVPSEELQVADDQATVLFRVLQEALTNVARHSQARSVHVSLSEYAGEFIMNVVDDGIGIKQEDIDNPRSFGILGIRERLRPFGGKCTIRRRERGGTELLVNLPKNK